MPIPLKWLVTAVLVSIGGTACAEDLPTLSLRYMTIEADVILVGEPINPQAGVLPAKYKVIDVLHGAGVKPGEDVVVQYLEVHDLPAALVKHYYKGAPPDIVKALLFLKYPTKNRQQDPYAAVLSGARALTKTGEILVPQQLTNPGPQYLLPRQGVEWDRMLAAVRNDLPAIAEMRALREIKDNASRNKAILRWIEEHKQTLGGSCFTEPPKGWGSLERQLIGWIMASCIPADCWSAVQFSELLAVHPNESHPAFCSPQGRELLLSKLSDNHVPEMLRLRALRELGYGGNYWYAYRSEYPLTKVVTQEEQQHVIDRVIPLLDYPDPAWRAAAVQCLMAVSWPGSANFRERTSKQAVPRLAELYRRERDTQVRNLAAEAIRRIETEAYWKDLTGNPEGIVVFVHFGGQRQESLHFQLNLDYTRAVIKEMPTLKMERLDSSGKPIETHILNPGLGYQKDVFREGWADWMGMIELSVPTSKVKPGLWRATFEGRVGEGGSWRSEPLEVVLPIP